MIKKHEQEPPVNAVVGAEPPRPDATETIREETRSPAFFSAYANDVQVQTTPWDMRVIFGELAITATPELPRVVVNSLGEVRMSPSLAKKVAVIMMQQLRIYEERFGAIPMPKD